MKAAERKITMGRKATFLMCFLLLTALLAGCSENKSAAVTNSPTPEEIAHAPSNENAKQGETEMVPVEKSTDQNQGPWQAAAQTLTASSCCGRRPCVTFILLHLVCVEPGV